MKNLLIISSKKYLSKKISDDIFKTVEKNNLKYDVFDVESDSKQLNLFQNTGNTHGDLMKIIDKIHLRFGESLLKLGNQDLNQTWKMRQEHLSSRYTTDIKEIIKVK